MILLEHLPYLYDGFLIRTASFGIFIRIRTFVTVLFSGERAVTHVERLVRNCLSGWLNMIELNWSIVENEGLFKRISGKRQFTCIERKTWIKVVNEATTPSVLVLGKLHTMTFSAPNNIYSVQLLCFCNLIKEETNGKFVFFDAYPFVFSLLTESRHF